MWTRIVLLVAFTLTLGGRSEIFDVTTIYEVDNLCTAQGDDPKTITLGEYTEQSTDKDIYGENKKLNCSSDVTGRIHSRTNAVGLPLYDGNCPDVTGTIHSHTNALGLPLCDGYCPVTTPQLFNITCDIYENNVCNWETKDWSLEPSYNKSWVKIQKGKYYNIIKFFKISLNKTSINGDTIFLFLTSSYSFNIKNVESHIISFETVSSAVTVKLFYSCDYSYDYYYHTYRKQYQINALDHDGNTYTFDCSSTDQLQLRFNDALAFKFDNGRIKLYSAENVSSSLDVLDSDDVKYFSMSGLNFERHSPSYAKAVPVYRASKEGSEMTSPIIIPDSNEMCLVLVIHSQLDTSDNLMHILAEDLFKTEHILHIVNNLKAGWNIRHINITLHGSIYRPIKLIIRKTNSMEIQISRISSCNTDGQEVKLLPPVFVSSDKVYKRKSIPLFLTSYTAITHVLEPVKTVLDEKRDCLNGGVLTSQGCACRPGFHGLHCRIGCGRNRYGQDCRGLCSLHDRECEGLLMCTSFTGCHCAPGYSGDNCKQQCSPDSYGNDCAQQCGQCASHSPCDMYTGKCVMCEFGYVPPFCQQEYVYYSKSPEISSPDYRTIKVSFSPENVTGVGTPKLYQIQYREKDGAWKIYTSNSLSSDNKDRINQVSVNIEGLKHGIFYQVRVLLMDASLNKYDGNKVQVSEIMTKCDVPEEYNYDVRAASNTTSFTFSWNYINNSTHWCPIELFEISWKDGWQWLSGISQAENFTLTDFLPGSTIKFKVRAKTNKGYAPYSKTVVASTNYNGSSAVEDLHTVSSQSTAVELAWRPPIGSESRPLWYKIMYKCINQPACPPGCHNATEGEITQDKTSVTLNPLLPFSQYQVTVTPEDGLETSIIVGTAEVVPMETPILSTKKPVRTNNSLTVFWDQGPICSSYIQGYNYQLTKESDSFKVLNSGFTKGTNISFYNLTASTVYFVKVYIVTSAGWNPNSSLVISTLTLPTVPDAVQNLTVYKRGRSMLGLRWVEPLVLYGKLKSFTVKYILGQDVKTRTIQPTRCIVWPDLYCYTIEDLKSNHMYNITVSARNVEVEENGYEAYVTGITKESSPGAPENLKLSNSSSTSVGLQWCYPNLANGILRSFVINIEETEKFDQDSCCQIYPLVETPVKEESQTYEVEVSGLHPASTYYVSVTAKTVGLGPSQSLVVYTRPPHLPVTTLPSQQIVEEIFDLDEELTWLPQEDLPEVNNSDVYTPLIKTQLLLAIFNESRPLEETIDSGIQDSSLHYLLQGLIKTTFYFVTEVSQEDVVVYKSVWGQPLGSSPLTPGQMYQLVVAQVTNYSGIYNADLRYSVVLTY